jgi:hypothetical protein
VQDVTLSLSEIYRLVNDYIGVSGGYLGDFSYKTHAEFYPQYCDLDIDPRQFVGTTRERFIDILKQAGPRDQAKILRGVFWKYPVANFPDTETARKQEIYSELQQVIRRLESLSGSPSDAVVASAIEEYDAEYVSRIWTQAIARRVDNPEAAITSARTLLESICKHILDDLGKTYEDDLDLPKLYRLTAEQLNLAPSQHTEQVFRQILGGCQAVVEGLGSVRNRLSDSHGIGRKPARPSSRHAELAVNLAGTMATFLIRTWEEQRRKQDEPAHANLQH